MNKKKKGAKRDNRSESRRKDKSKGKKPNRLKEEFNWSGEIPTHRKMDWGKEKIGEE